MSSLFDYKYPGQYLLINCEDEIYNDLLNTGYIVYRFNSLEEIDYNESIDSIDYFYVRFSIENSDFTNLYKIICNLNIKLFKISIDCVDNNHLEFINFLEKNNYRNINKEIIKEGENRVNIELINNYLFEYNVTLDEKVHYFSETLDKVTSYICPGDEILILDDGNENIRNYLSYKINSNNLNFLHSADISTNIKNNNYNFILFIDNDIELNSITLDFISKSLVPSGRCVLLKQETSVLKILKSINLDIESYSTNDNETLSIVDYTGSIINSYSDILILMKNPLIFKGFEYNESIYGYSSPPDNLLAFPRDYINPWIVRSLVEFPFRNKSRFNLKNYCLQILETYPPLSPDYGSALAVLGYQYLNNYNPDEFIIYKITDYCCDIYKDSHLSPHQIRWYISLCTLLGQIYRKKSDFIKSMYWFSKAYRSSTKEFSPTISTKILQSYYMNVTMLLSLGKISCATILLNTSINRINTFFNVHENELLGQKSFPLNFVMYIYHDIIDWVIKLINIKRSLSIGRLELFSLVNNNTWSALLAERMQAINSQTILIDERDITIKDQAKIIDERDIAIKAQTLMIDERDLTIRDQTQLIDEKDNTIANQEKLIQNLENIVREYTDSNKN
ncbi:hypothetical protein HH682_11580 [Rosenbergiella sp. S61]|uniref:Glycosyl transferase family 2 n=1 Tax=Rosenbergiella gaditana TaxID=2726987 RepID=A0ABS5SY61_9GAMM|nr:hypothetical protein [Rosenbergiella gaditana]MBT0725044.1 hypothetical protein [Rosenbergiella gaditana]